MQHSPTCTAAPPPPIASAETQPPARQIVLLHESAIRRLEEARAAIGERRIEARFNLVMKAHAIVGALQSCLDFERGGEIAPMLDRLYGHMLERLTAINLRNDPADLRRADRAARPHARRLGDHCARRRLRPDASTASSRHRSPHDDVERLIGKPDRTGRTASRSGATRVRPQHAAAPALPVAYRPSVRLRPASSRNTKTLQPDLHQAQRRAIASRRRADAAGLGCRCARLARVERRPGRRCWVAGAPPGCDRSAMVPGFARPQRCLKCLAQ